MHRTRCGLLALTTVVSLVISLAAPAFAVQPSSNPPVTLVADHIEYDTQTGSIVAEGHVQASRGEDTIMADRVSGNLNTEQMEATGHVTLIQDGRKATGESLQYNFRTRTGRMTQVTTQYGPWHVETQSLEASGNQGVANQASVTPCDPRHPFFKFTARRVVVVPGDTLTAYDAALYVYGVHVATLPVYTASLKPGRKAQSGPSAGYNTLDGVWVEYNYFSISANLTNQLRLRYGSLSYFTVEDILSLQEGDHLWALDLGRHEIFDTSGNLVNLDVYAASLAYDPHRIPGWPLTYQIQGEGGWYSELATGVRTTRGDALLTVATDTIPIAPTVTAAASALFRYDTYGTGQQRTDIEISAAITKTLSQITSLTLAYGLVAIGGSTPFTFDSRGSINNIALSYSYYPGTGFLQSGSVTVTEDLYAQQTFVGIAAAFALSPTLLFSGSAIYNTSLSQWTEIDYAIRATCDCLAVGVVYRTFPQNPSQNQILLTIGLTPFPETSATLRF